MLSALYLLKADNSYYKQLDYYIKPDILILDELEFKKIPNYSADNILASAIIDRIVHYSTVIKVNGRSYRTKNNKKERKGEEDVIFFAYIYGIFVAHNSGILFDFEV